MLPDPASPLGWTLVFEKGLLPGWLRGHGRVRHLPRRRTADATARRSSVLFGGYFYINLSHCRVMAIRMGMTVEAFDAALLGSADVAPPYKPHPEDVDADASAKVGATIGEILGATTFPKIEADLARVLDLRRNRPDLDIDCPMQSWLRMRALSCPSSTTRSPSTTTRRSDRRWARRCSASCARPPARRTPCSS